MNSALIINVRLATLCGVGYGLIEQGAVGWHDGIITWLGRMQDLPDKVRDAAYEVIQGEGRLLTPGLIDCHTHLVFAGDRVAEFEQRLQGASYEAISRAGGGISASIQATRAASENELLRQSLPRAKSLLAHGATTLEIKSGYGLELESELKMLRVAKRIGEELGISVRTTFLGAHAVPPEYTGKPDAYIDMLCEQMLPAIAGSGLADAVDAFCESIAFKPPQVRRVFESARELGLPVKLHADQLSNLHGAALTAEFEGLSADHLEYTDLEGVAELAASGSVAVLLPGAFYALAETQQPPLTALRKHAVPIAVASDLNPGTSPLQSLPLAMNMACTLFGLTALEALLGVTVHAAAALGLADRGRLALGLRADLVLWNAHQPAELAYWIGANAAHQVICAGHVRE